MSNLGFEFLKLQRQAFELPAALCFDNGTLPEECFVIEISRSGGRLRVESPAAVPDKFTLLLSDNGLVRRQCSVEWRTDAEIGVKFL